MRPIFSASLAVLFFFLLFFLVSCFPNPAGESIVEYAIAAEGDIAVHFCPGEDCEAILLNFLEGAETSIHCAFYDPGLESVKSLLRKKAEFMDVKVVIDDSYAKKFAEPFVKMDKGGLMHDKFCIVDGAAVFTGSMNPTDNDAHKNNNNILLIHAPAIARNYEDEFEELWVGEFKSGEKVASPVIQLGNTTIKTYFCPEDECAAKVVQEIRQAKESVFFMTFSFTHEDITNMLLRKYADGVEVKGVMDESQISQYSAYELLRYQTSNVLLDGNKYKLHHKVFIIDGKTAITGSFNPTKGGDVRNDENLVIIEDERIAALYLEEFGKVWGEASRGII